MDSVEILSLSDLPVSPSANTATATPTAGPRHTSSGPDSGRVSSPEELGLSPGNPRLSGSGSEGGPEPSSQAQKGEFWDMNGGSEGRHPPKLRVGCCVLGVLYCTMGGLVFVCMPLRPDSVPCRFKGRFQTQQNQEGLCSAVR